MERGRGYLKGRRIFFVYTHGIQDHDLDGVGAGMWGGGCRGWGGEEREVGGGVGRGVRLLSIRIMAFISA